MDQQSIIIEVIEYIFRQQEEKEQQIQLNSSQNMSKYQKKSSEDRLASATKDLIAILKKPPAPTLFLNQGTKTNDTIWKVRGIFTPRQQNKAFTEMPGRAATKVNR